MTTKTGVSMKEKMHSDRLQLFNKINDACVTIARVNPLIRREIVRCTHAKKSRDHEISVPAKSGGRTIAKRSNDELVSVLSEFHKTDLYQNYLVLLVSMFEGHIAGLLETFLSYDLNKLSIGANGGESKREILIEKVLEFDSIDSLRASIIRTRIQSALYASPRDYAKYFGSVSEIGMSVDDFVEYFEIKATRDLIVHNSCVINEVYMQKVEGLARGRIGETIAVDKKYFDASVSILKKLAYKIDQKIQARY